jgi:hypothetical protein
MNKRELKGVDALDHILGHRLTHAPPLQVREHPSQY